MVTTERGFLGFLVSWSYRNSFCQSNSILCLVFSTYKIMIRSLSFISHSSCFILSASGLVFSYSLKSFFVISQSNSRRLIFLVVDDICSTNSATSNLRFSIISGISYIEVSRLLAICVTSSI